MGCFPPSPTTLKTHFHPHPNPLPTIHGYLHRATPPQPTSSTPLFTPGPLEPVPLNQSSPPTHSRTPTPTNQQTLSQADPSPTPAPSTASIPSTFTPPLSSPPLFSAPSPEHSLSTQDASQLAPPDNIQPTPGHTTPPIPDDALSLYHPSPNSSPPLTLDEPEPTPEDPTDNFTPRSLIHGITHHPTNDQRKSLLASINTQISHLRALVAEDIPPSPPSPAADISTNTPGVVAGEDNLLSPSTCSTGTSPGSSLGDKCAATALQRLMEIRGNTSSSPQPPSTFQPTEHSHDHRTQDIAPPIPISKQTNPHYRQRRTSHNSSCDPLPPPAVSLTPPPTEPLSPPTPTSSSTSNLADLPTITSRRTNLGPREPDRIPPPDTTPGTPLMMKMVLMASTTKNNLHPLTTRPPFSSSEKWRSTFTRLLLG
ncbi:mucin-2-like [Xenia sp. Carnegie-2017]|uniref:mucin-2-like n=1 Tax=Xenia sp. Carnegie-2017 TaxID=2897299 RepID=UPI001F0475A4|nr:mucin-2-like [Xenia sp. Carnegie-2017]